MSDEAWHVRSLLRGERLGMEERVKKIVIAMYDRCGYTKKLADYFCRHQRNLLDVRLFTREDSLRNFLAQECTELLVTGEQEWELLRDAGSRVRKWILLSDGQCVREDVGQTVIFKYQSAESVLQTVLAEIADDDQMHVPIRKKQVNGTSLIGVYAPFGGAGVSTFSWKLVQEYRLQGKCLFMDLQVFAGCPFDNAGKRTDAWDAMETMGMSELIFFLRQHREKVALKLESLVRHYEGIDYLAAVEDYRDLYSMTVSDLQHLLAVLAEETSYSTVVFDVGFFNETAMELLKCVDTLYIPKPVTGVQERKQKSFTDLLRREGLHELAEQIQYVEMHS